MKKWNTLLILAGVLAFSAWMAITHEPKSILDTRIQGTFIDFVNGGEVSVRLESGEQITLVPPRQLPRQKPLKVTMEITEHHWTGKRSYRITNWSSR